MAALTAFLSCFATCHVFFLSLRELAQLTLLIFVVFSSFRVHPVAGLVTKPKPYRVRIEARSAAARNVIEQAAEAACTDILDFDSVELPA